jgi:predicted GIY-YIG superfamily endonuclease
MDISFNILECFDENISNLDITRNYIYVLQLIEDRYYVGRTGNILRRIQEHFTGCGALYTMKYKPLKLIEIKEELTNTDERNKTIEIMNKYGWEKVRGAHWCSLEIKKPNIEKNKKYKVNKDKKEVKYDIDKNIRELYCSENKNIIEISVMLDITPGLVAFRLEKLNIVNRRQLSRGYFEYIGSDLYKINIMRKKEKREKNSTIIIETNNNTSTKLDLKNIKQRIRDKILNAKSCDCI